MATAGHEIVILGRDRRAARQAWPDAALIEADLADPGSAASWHARLDTVDAVVNAAGALQSSRRDRLDAVHYLSIVGLVQACEARGVSRFIQISSVGARPDATTEFLRTKAQGDEVVRSSSLEWFVIRPGLVIGPNAYGGTALIRALAGVPLVQPIAFAEAPIQTVSIDDLTGVVLDAVDARLPAGVEFDLVEDSVHSLAEVLGQFRRWLGLGPARLRLPLPRFGLRFISKLADLIAFLGWRSPLRTTVLQVLTDGVRGDADAFRATSSRRLSSLGETLAAMPATVQDRWFSRLYLAMPVMLVVLAIFWMLTGVIALINLDGTVQVSGLSGGFARQAVISGAVVDLVLGAAILYRPWARRACLGMCLVTVLYLAAGTVIRPELWADPMGPLLKAVPIIVLAALSALTIEDR